MERGMEGVSDLAIRRWPVAAVIIRRVSANVTDPDFGRQRMLSRTALSYRRDQRCPLNVESGRREPFCALSGIRPERALIEAPAEHREGWIEIIRSHHSRRRECANSGLPDGALSGHIEARLTARSSGASRSKINLPRLALGSLSGGL